MVKGLIDFHIWKCSLCSSESLITCKWKYLYIRLLHKACVVWWEGTRTKLHFFLFTRLLEIQFIPSCKYIWGNWLYNVKDPLRSHWPDTPLSNPAYSQKPGGERRRGFPHRSALTVPAGERHLQEWLPKFKLVLLSSNQFFSMTSWTSQIVFICLKLTHKTFVSRNALIQMPHHSCFLKALLSVMSMT